jgi:hypothetical protein
VACPSWVLASAPWALAAAVPVTIGDGSEEPPSAEAEAEGETSEEPAVEEAAKGATGAETCAGGSGQAEVEELAAGRSGEAQMSASAHQRRAAFAEEVPMLASGLQRTTAAFEGAEGAEDVEDVEGVGAAGTHTVVAVAAASSAVHSGASSGSGAGRCAVAACRRTHLAVAPEDRRVAACQVLFGSHFWRKVSIPFAAVGGYGREERMERH